MTFYLVNTGHKFDFILLTNQTPNEMPQTEMAYLRYPGYIQCATHTLKVTDILACQEQHKHAPTGTPNITKHLSPHNTFCTVEYHLMT